MKSDTCFGKVSGKPLTEFFTEQDAQNTAEYSKIHYENILAPYDCKKCDFWHLSPTARQTPSTKCQYCTAGDGEYKNSYKTKGDAHKRANILYFEQGHLLDVYKCRYGNGWHLTKSKF